MLDVSGSIPDAIYAAAVAWEASLSALGSCGMVMACRSTTQKNVSAEAFETCKMEYILLAELLWCKLVHEYNVYTCRRSESHRSAP